MKHIFLKSGLVAFICMSLFGTAFSRDCEWERSNSNRAKLQAKAAACKRAQSSAELNVNNVRALINAYGNMWYDGSLAKYNIPKNGTSTAMFCAALWIGGTDVDDQLRIAALRFGSEGNDYWPGPLTVDGTASVSAEVCNEYDKHFKITQADVSTFKGMFDYEEGSAPTPNDSYDESLIPDVIKNWPAHGNTAMKQSKYLAPFYDADGDGEYNYTKGDYPYYDFDNVLCPKTLKAALNPGEKYEPAPTMEGKYGTGGQAITGGILSDQVLKGDQTIWWVFNDMGNSHTESRGDQIGLEIRAQAFAFATNDEINNMTFYTYEIINRSSYTLRNTYFSQWVDPDLGYSHDDYVGCDVRRGLGYCYNGKDVDGPGTGSYSGIPPAVGIDFFQGPYMDPDHSDNPKIDIDKMRVYYEAALAGYQLDPNNPSAGYDTIRLSEEADAYINAWYFKKDDVIGNCAINGVNFGNGIVDDERFGMRRFVYYNNSLNGTNGEPEKASDYYNYLRGYWKNNTRMTFGGDGTKGGTDALECDFMFPGDSDPWNWGTNGEDPGLVWTEKTPAAGESGNNPGDRRFMQSAGPFTLKPGAINYITVGIPFAQATSGNAWSSVELLRQVDDKCQSLFENCFKILTGPEAPTVTVQELSNEVILYLSYENPESNNNKNGIPESFNEMDPSIPTTYSVDTTVTIRTGTTTKDSTYSIIKTYSQDQRTYKFEGYQIYQLKDANASVADIGDETKARLVYQCDIENYYDADRTLPIGTLVNYDLDNALGTIAPQVMVTGANTGIRHSIRLTTDAFATGTNTKLVNNKEYYFVAVAYAHNRYKEYSPTDANKLDGQKKPYLAGRQNEWKQEIKPVKAIPHNISTENGGTIVQAAYGTSPVITRIEGYGNGGFVLQLTDASIEELMGAPGEEGKPAGRFVRSGMNERMEDPCIIANPTYKEDHGPLNITIVDPLNVKRGKYYIRFNGAENDSRWTIESVDGSPLFNDAMGNPVYVDSSDFTIGRYNEQLFLDLGIAVGITNVEHVATPVTVSGKTILGGLVNNGALLNSEMHFADPNKQWLSAIPDYDAVPTYNWIRSGSQFTEGERSTFVGDTSDFTGSEAYLDADYYKYQWNESLGRSESYALDKYSIFEGVVGGTWSPYGMVSTRSFHPGFSYMYYVAPESRFDSLRRHTSSLTAKIYQSRNYQRRMLQVQLDNKSLNYNDMANLPSVHIVITPDQTKWTRCPVLEMCDDPTQSEGNALRFQMRKAYSVDKNGNVDTTYDRKYGMGWFPGYAIDVETGERLNMMFGEDSRYVQHNGRDMMWNPVNTIMDGTQNYVMGGGHFIYVLKSNNQPFVDISRVSDNVVSRYYKTPSYDGGIWAARMLESLDRLMHIRDNQPMMAYCNGLLLGESQQYVRPQRDSAALLFASVAWVNMPIVSSNFLFNNPKDIPCDVTIDIAVRRPYATYYSANQTAPSQAGQQLRNANNPMYMFEMTDDLITLTNQAGGRIDKQTILDNITVVPNPYYSASEYETSSQLDSRVRITNLPANSKIAIYTVDGTLVRKLGPSPTDAGNADRGYTLDWDLKNHIGIPIAGGMYLIHVTVPEIGERVIKWFGTMRPVDLNSFK